MSVTITGIRELAAPRLQAVELAQAYANGPVSGLLDALAAGRPDSERAGQLLKVRTGRFSRSGWQFDLHGARTGQRLGGLQIVGPGLDPRAIALALTLAVNPPDSASIAERDLLHSLTGQAGWDCAHCGEAFVRYDDCVSHEITHTA